MCVQVYTLVRFSMKVLCTSTGEREIAHSLQLPVACTHTLHRGYQTSLLLLEENQLGQLPAYFIADDFFNHPGAKLMEPDYREAHS